MFNYQIDDVTDVLLFLGSSHMSHPMSPARTRATRTTTSRRSSSWHPPWGDPDRRNCDRAIRELPAIDFVFFVNNIIIWINHDKSICIYWILLVNLCNSWCVQTCFVYVDRPASLVEMPTNGAKPPLAHWSLGEWRLRVCQLISVHKRFEKDSMDLIFVGVYVATKRHRCGRDNTNGSWVSKRRSLCRWGPFNSSCFE